MKNRIYNALMLLVLIACLTINSSCTQRTLDPPYVACKIKFVFDWKNIPNGDPAPTKMNLCLYNSDGSVVNKQCSATDGYSGDIPIGTYKVLAYSADATSITYQDMGMYETAAVTVPLLAGTTYMDQPKNVYVATNANVSALAVDNGTVTMTPDLVSKKAVLKMVITGDKSLVTSNSVTLSGITKTEKMTNSNLQSGSETITFIAQPTVTGFESTFNLLGKDVSSSNMVNVTFGFKDGSKQNMDPIDISTSMADINKFPNSYLIVTVVLNIEIVGSEQAGFTAKLKNWYPDYRDVTAL